VFVVSPPTRGRITLDATWKKDGKGMTVPPAPHIQQITYYDKTYEVDIYGYLIDPREWTERFTKRKATEVGAGRLTDNHWTLLRILREEFFRTRQVPTAREACHAAGIELEELERLFPLGYLRCAVKLAGLNPLSWKVTP
jgi:tRNA 2-thiouridine synthesizing protein E